MVEARTVVVTGAAAGMGLAAAIRFARDGDDVVAGVRSPAREAPVRDAAAAAGVDLDVVVMDVCDDASVAVAFEDIRARHGDVEVMVANAGVGSLGTLEQLTMDDLRAAMEVNYFGVVRTTKAVLPGMRERGHGRLIAVSSVGGAFGQPFTDAYAAAKHAAEGLYESLQPVAARFGVHVSIVEPGPVATQFHDKSTRVERAGSAGDPYEALWNQYEAVMAGGAARRQDIEEAAQVIVDVANTHTPVLRYQTSKFTTRLVGIKLADLDGTGVTGFTSRWFDPPG